MSFVIVLSVVLLSTTLMSVLVSVLWQAESPKPAISMAVVNSARAFMAFPPKSPDRGWR